MNAIIFQAQEILHRLTVSLSVLIHYDGQLIGDYDRCKTEEKIINMLKNGR